jgi:hypothetical protein
MAIMFYRSTGMCDGERSVRGEVLKFGGVDSFW